MHAGLTSFITVKIAEWKDRRRALPEFEECKRLALAHGLPLRVVHEILLVEL